MPMPAPTSVVVADIGFSNAKFAWDGGTGVPRQLVVPSGAAPIADLVQRDERIDDTQGAMSVLLPDGSEWIAGVPHDERETNSRVLDRSYPKSPEYAANILSVLLRSELRAVDLLVLGLPVSQYLEDEGLMNEMVSRWTGTHYPRKGSAVVVRKVAVIPQPMGACARIMASRPEVRGKDDTRVLVIDPGFWSVDWVVVDKMALRRASSGSSTMATSKIIEECSRRLRAAGYGTHSVERIEGWVRNGETDVRVGPKLIPLAEHMAAAAEVISGVVAKEILRSIRNEQGDVDWVVLAGGGARYYEKAVSELFGAERLVVPAKPVMANADGYLIWGRSHARAQLAAAVAA